MTAPVEETAPAGNRRVMIVALVGAALILGILVISTMSGGGGDDEDATPTPTTAVRVTTTTTTVAGGATATESFEVFDAKNPFLPLRGTTGGTATTGTGTGTSGTGTSGTGTGTSTGGTGTATGGTGTSTGTGGTTATTTSGSTSGTTSGGSTAPRQGQRVTLLDVFAEGGRVVANVRVNDRVYKVGAGDTFATSYRVVSLDQGSSCGRFVFGDDSFRLCEGEATLK